jgi:hypothetical protein
MQTDSATPAIPTDDLSLTAEDYFQIVREIEEQPHWRIIADKEMDYADGNQLDSDILRKQKELGIPPAVEDLIGPALLSIQGYEATIRTDWRVSPNGESDGKDVADVLNFKLNQAERASKADRACSHAFRSQIGCGIGWVEVSRESDPFKFPYRCSKVHRNEMHWDMKAQEDDLSDARWQRRQRWLAPERVMLVFPQHKELIMQCKTHGAQWWSYADAAAIDGGTSTGLQNAWTEGRASTILEDRWYNPTSKELCIAEVWYRRWVNVPVIKTPDGRVVEYDDTNMAHAIAVISGSAKPIQATVTRVRRSYWLGPHCLHDGESPYNHRHFPYVPFVGFREDQTGIPYGFVRGMKYAQDSLNSGNSKLRWGMSVTRVERTKGAVAMTDAQLRRQIARPDADVVLDADHMARQGARFEVKRDYQLTDQHYQMMQDNRATIERVSNITTGFMGRKGNATSGVQEQTQVEQSTQSLAFIMDNFRSARTQVGELLLAMIIEDIGTAQHTVVIEGDAVTPDREVVLNVPRVDASGMQYLSNDLQRTRLKVALEDVPSSNSYRGQQLNALSEAVKSMPQQYQAAVLPFLVSLMDVPFKRDVVEAIRGASQQPTEEQIKQQIQDALSKAGTDLKARELDIKERKADSEIKGLDASTLQTIVQAMYSAMQGGGQVAQMPMVAPIADKIMQAAGYQPPTPSGIDPNFPQPNQLAIAAAPAVQKNTSPGFPPVPQQAESGMQGIETPATADNLVPLS